MTAKIVTEDDDCRLVCECGHVIFSAIGFSDMRITAPISCPKCGESIGKKGCEDELR